MNRVFVYLKLIIIICLEFVCKYFNNVVDLDFGIRLER